MTIRPMKIEDAEAISNLSHQLGYPVDAGTTAKRIEIVLAQPGHAGFSAEIDGRVVGWIHVYVSHIIESENSYTEIGGLVVDEQMRGQGVGKALVHAAEDWTREMGLNDIRLRTQIHRAEAHQFYQKLGFEVVKTQLRMMKKL